MSTKKTGDARDIPHVKCWIAQFRRLATLMPPEVWVFVASGRPYVMTTPPQYLPNDGVDPRTVIARISGGTWDGSVGHVILTWSGGSRRPMTLSSLAFFA